MVVLITGGSRGIGRATALKFAKNGYDIALNYYSKDQSANETKEMILECGVRCILEKCDVSNEDDVKIMIDDIITNFGRIDCVVNNAGISCDSLPFEKDIADFKRVIDVNLIGTYLICKCASEYMDFGSIVNVASNTGMNAYYPYSLDYDASKAGVISLTHNLSVELSPNIRVNAVSPGWVNTDMNKNIDDDYIKEECENIFLRRFAKPEEIANVIFFLCSEESSYINNSVIRVDGGTYGSC